MTDLDAGSTHSKKGKIRVRFELNKVRDTVSIIQIHV